MNQHFSDLQKKPTYHVKPALTEREIIVLRHLATCETTRHIAKTLFVSTNTIKSQLRSAYRKLGVSCKNDAIEKASRMGLL
ncbi:LuxR C-terminal-related transcriptional regulator [Lysinibacter sp. HNR]|uniref:response regulator transcription factor n=1 Tax=Lysinibacter sp. HNR TaxID=3031408 RepID=UPI002434A14B|nr:LuxR C-terminal-related transcriptional regulator [Lysinibacter sp. HNR]WGD37738.1 LuxR C-terminal-related transcriptional regulator [Lysinibacter sp. HNR]